MQGKAGRCKVATEYLRGYSHKHNDGLIRKTTSGKWVAEINRDGRRNRKVLDAFQSAIKWIDEQSLMTFPQKTGQV